MNRIIMMCLKNLSGYTPVSVLELMAENIREAHVHFKVIGPEIHIGVKKVKPRYNILIHENGKFKNIEILKAFVSFYNIHLENDCEPHLSEFKRKVQNTDFSVFPIYIVKKT